MKIFAVFDKKGFPKAFFSPDIHKEIPAEAIEIEEAVWKQLITNPKLVYIDGELIDTTNKVWEEGKGWREKTDDDVLKEEKETQIRKLNQKTKDYITKILRKLDWGNTYEEALSELQNSALDTETRILYFLKPKLDDITLTQIREKIALYLAGQYTIEDLQKDLEEKSFTQEEIEKFLPLFAEAAEVANLIYWAEEVWEKEEELEEAILKATSIEEIDRLMASIQFPLPPGGRD